jgi:hypothetical protein
MSIPSNPYSSITEIAEFASTSQPPSEMYVLRDDYFFLSAGNLVQYSLSLLLVVVIVKSLESILANE